jgi:hypothetical protein
MSDPLPRRMNRCELPFSPCFSASSSSPVASSSSPKNWLRWQLSIEHTPKERFNVPHEIGLTPDYAVNWLARSRSDGANRKGLWGLLRYTVEAFCNILPNCQHNAGISHDYSSPPSAGVGLGQDIQLFQTLLREPVQPCTFC